VPTFNNLKTTDSQFVIICKKHIYIKHYG